MKLVTRTPEKTLRPALLRQPVPCAQLAAFQKQLADLQKRVGTATAEGEREEHVKTCLREFVRRNRRHNVSVYPDDWKALPVPDISMEQQEPIVAVVDKILAAKKADAKADISALEAEVDKLVCAAYGSSTDGES